MSGPSPSLHAGQCRQGGRDLSDRHHGHSVDGTGRRRDLPSVEDHHRVRQRGVRDVAQVAVRQPRRPCVIRRRRQPLVRKPFQPIPVRCGRPSDHGGDGDVRGAVKYRELAHHRADDAARTTELTVDHHHGVQGDLHGDRQPRDGRPCAQQSVERVGGDGVAGLGGLELGSDERRGQRLPAKPDPDGSEVGVAGTAFPHARSADQRPQRVGFRMVPECRPVLCISGPRGRVVDLVEVAQVLAATSIELAAVVAACRVRQ